MGDKKRLEYYRSPHLGYRVADLDARIFRRKRLSDRVVRFTVEKIFENEHLRFAKIGDAEGV